MSICSKLRRPGAAYNPRSNAFKASLQCLNAPIINNYAATKSFVEELGFSDSVRIPTINDLQSETPEELTDEFARLVSGLRTNIRDVN